MLQTTQFINTKSFNLAIYKQGDETSEKLILLLPGRLDTKDYAHMRKHVDLLSKKGYLAISFDPPGSWESGEDIKSYSTTNYLKAVEEIIEYFAYKPTILIGHSRGGSLAILGGTRIKHVIGFIDVMGNPTYKPENYVVDKKWKEDGFTIEKRDTPKEYEEEYVEFKLPFSFIEDSLQYDMLPDLKKSTKPKLFIAGLQDTLVSKEKIKEGFEISHESKQYTEIDSGHDYRFNEYKIEEVNTIIEKFLENYELYSR